MVVELRGVPFKNVIDSVKAEIERRQTHTKEEKKRPLPAISASVSAVERIRTSKNLGGIKKNRNRDQICYVCGKQGKFAEKCYFGRGRAYDR